MKSPNFRSSAAASRIKSISSCSGIQTVCRAVRFSGMAATQNKKTRAEAPAKTLDPEGGWVESSGRDEVARMSGGLLIAGAQIGPIHIGAQVFAAHSAVSSALDSRTTLCRNIAAHNPVVNHLRNNANDFCQSRLPAEQFDRFIKSFHSRKIKHVGNLCQQMVFDSINKCCRIAP